MEFVLARERLVPEPGGVEALEADRAAALGGRLRHARHGAGTAPSARAAEGPSGRLELGSYIILAST